MSKYSVAILASLALLVAAPASAQQPPTDRYTLNVVLETVGGEVLFKATAECDPLVWCDVRAPGPVTIAGRQRPLTVRTRVKGPLLDIQRYFSAADAHENSRRMLYGDEMPFRKNQKAAIALFDTEDSSEAWGSRVKPKIGQLRLEIKY